MFNTAYEWFSVVNFVHCASFAMQLTISCYHTHNHAHNVSWMALMRFWLAKCELKLFRQSGDNVQGSGGSCSCVDALGNQRQQQVCVSVCACASMGHLIALRIAVGQWGSASGGRGESKEQRRGEKWPTNDKVQRQSTSLVFILCRSVKKTRQTTE